MLVWLGGEVQEVSRPLSGPPTRFLAVTLLGLVLALGFTAFRVWQVGTDDDERPVDAIVVLGAAQYDGRPSPVFAARLDHAIDLYRAGVAKHLVVTGGKADGDRVTEGAAARAYRTARGVPPTTRSWAATTAGPRWPRSGRSPRVLRDHDLRTAVFVSDSTHMLRVLRMARDIGIDGHGSPTRTEPGRSRSVAWAGRRRRTRSAVWSSTS